MAEIKAADLFGRLNQFGFKSLEGATTFCKMRGNPQVELVHWFHQMLNDQDSDLHRIIKHYSLDSSKLVAQLTTALNRLPGGASGISGFAQSLRVAVEQGWILASLMFKQGRIRSGHVLLGLLKDGSQSNYLFGLSDQFRLLNADKLTDELTAITKGSPEDAMTESVGGGVSPGEASGAIAPAEMGKQEALKKFAVDLTQNAKDGKIDPIFGRDEEIRQIIDILMRRRQNNPILTGEAGVGKTAVVEGFARRIVSGDVPPALRDVRLMTLDLGLLQAGASMKGEFEDRLKHVIEEVQSSPTPIILFIDEAHQLIGAGGSAGQNDAANLLKPALARGTLRTIAATTWAEYKKYFEKDPALTRRFQVIKVEEPDEAKAISMIRGLGENLEKHHKVMILDEALEAAVKLSQRYIPGRQLPDKAVSLIDTACARVAVTQHSTPARLEDALKATEVYKVHQQLLFKEAAGGSDHDVRLAEVGEKLSQLAVQTEELTKTWETEKGIVNELLELRKKLQVNAAASATGSEEVAAERVKLMEELRAKESQMKITQGDHPLVHAEVDANAVAAVVADWTGIPVGRMVKNEIQAVLNLVDSLEKRVVGQRHALETIAKRIETSRAGLDNPTKPIGVFMLAGTSGVGKTETALALAETLYGGEANLITINMSEFQEAHTVSSLKGAPPGYVGYGEGGVLTEAVRRRPYSVVLLDEVEKAHTDVHEIFFQVFDKGAMDDGEGRAIDFKNCIIILTTNAGTDLLISMCKDPELMPDPDSLAKALRAPLLKVFPPALLGRLTVVPFYPLSEEVLRLIIRLQLKRVQKRVKENRGITLTFGEDVVDLMASRCNEVDSGGRIVDAILTQTLLPELSRKLLVAMSEENMPTHIELKVKDAAFDYVFS